MLLGVPVMIFIALAAPALWSLAGGWIVAIACLLGLDALLSARLTAFSITPKPPAVLFVGAEDPFNVEFTFETGPTPSRMKVTLETNYLLDKVRTANLTGWADNTRPYAFTLRPNRRGMAHVAAIWCRWRGPLGLIQKTVRDPINLSIPITPNIKWVKDEAIRLFSRDAEFGLKTQMERGDGSEFDALREFTTGMDRRAIDWKHSARHRVLLAKEFRTERNHNIVFAFDTGRLMSEPLGGIPKIDRAVHAGLLLSFVSLRNGDRTMLYGFDAKPGASTGFITGHRGFPKVQSAAANLNYSTHETNFTLALSTLASKLERRSLIVIFSDFVDTISAELMLENVRRLSKKHLVIFATFEDELLNSLADASPDTNTALAKAVLSDSLLLERDMVLRRLQRLGVEIIEARPDAFGAELISRYLKIKQRDML